MKVFCLVDPEERSTALILSSGLFSLVSLMLLWLLLSFLSFSRFRLEEFFSITYFELVLLWLLFLLLLPFDPVRSLTAFLFCFVCAWTTLLTLIDGCCFSFVSFVLYLRSFSHTLYYISHFSVALLHFFSFSDFKGLLGTLVHAVGTSTYYKVGILSSIHIILVWCWIRDIYAIVLVLFVRIRFRFYIVYSRNATRLILS